MGTKINLFHVNKAVLLKTYVAYKNAFFLKMQLWSHCYTVVSYQELYRLSEYKIPDVNLSGAQMCVLARYTTLVPLLIISVFNFQTRVSCK